MFTHVYVVAASIVGKKSVIDKPFSYSHHQKVVGLTFDAVVMILLLTWIGIVWYRNFGPGAKKRPAQS